jgi:hypothetical protein
VAADRQPGEPAAGRADARAAPGAAQRSPLTFGPLTTSVAWSRTQLSEAADLGRLRDVTKGEVALSLSLPKLPVLTFALEHEESGMQTAPLLLPAGRARRDGAKLSLWHGEGIWSLWAGAAWSALRAESEPEAALQSTSHFLGGALGPWHGWTLSSGVDVTEIRDTHSQFRMGTRSACLSMGYAAEHTPWSADLSLTAAANRDSSGSLNDRRLDLSLSAGRRLGRHPRADAPLLGVRLLHSRYRDLAHASANAEVSAALLFLEIRR